MNRLTTDQFNKLTYLLDTTKVDSYSKYGFLQGPNKKRLKSQATPLSFTNKELVNFICEIANQDILKLVIITKDEYLGGKFYINGKDVPEFKSNGDYLIYDGSNTSHGVHMVTKGLRQTLACFFDNNISLI